MMFSSIFCMVGIFLSVAFAQSNYWQEPYDANTRSIVDDTTKITVGLLNYYTKDEFYSVIYKTYKSYFHLHPNKVLMMVYLKTTNCTKNTDCRPKPLNELKGCCQFQSDAIAKFKQCEIVVDTAKNPDNKGNVEVENCASTTKADADNNIWKGKTIVDPNSKETSTTKSASRSVLSKSLISIVTFIVLTVWKFF